MADFDETTRHAVKVKPRGKAPEASDPNVAIEDMPPDMTVEQTLDWVSGDRRRARVALEEEQGKREPRTTLVGNLQRLAAGDTGAGVGSGEA